MPSVEPAADDGRSTPGNMLAGLGDFAPAIAIASGVVLLGLLVWFFRRRRFGDDRDDEPQDDQRRFDRHERFDLGFDMRAPPEPEPGPVAAPGPAAERVPFAPVSDDLAPAAAAPAAASGIDEVPVPPVEDRVVSPAISPVATATAGEVAMAPAARATGRAMLDVALHPRRAGTNLTSAAVEYDVIVHNGGAAAAKDVRLDVRLLTAGAQQDAIIDALFSEPIERAITAPFDLLPGTNVKLGGMGILPREQVGAMTVDGRPLFVPVMTVNLTYDWPGGSGQTARSFVIGIQRPAGTKMGAFRLDEVRMYAEVGALEYTIAVDR